MSARDRSTPRCRKRRSSSIVDMVPPQLSGEVVAVEPWKRAYRIVDEILQVRDDEETGAFAYADAEMADPAGPSGQQRVCPSAVPLITGQRDHRYAVSRSPRAARRPFPGGFGTGKTMTQHQLAKWCDADIIVYVGCGERGNEMTQVLEEFSELIDPKTSSPLTGSHGADRQYLQHAGGRA